MLGEPTVLDADSEGEARTSLEAPPPLLEDPPPPCDAAAAAEEASCEAGCGAMVLAREDSSWPAEGCCPACEGKNSDDVEEAVDDLRLLTCRVEEDGGSAGKLDEAGEKAAREPLGEGVLRCSWAKAVEMGVRRVLWWCLDGPQ